MSITLGSVTGRLFHATVVAAVLIAAVRGIVSAQAKGTVSRIAFVSVQRIAAQSNAAQASGKRLQQFREEKARAIGEKQKQVESLRLEVARSGGVFQTARRQKAKQDEARAMHELQKLQSDTQAELQKMQHEFQTELQGQLAAVLSTLAKQRGADVVLNQDTTVVIAAGGADWTADVIERLNAPQPASKNP